MAFSNGYALLIGVHENSVAEWSLPVVLKDIEALAGVLRHPDRCGYIEDNIRVITGQNATKQNILQGLEWIKAKLDVDKGSNATALIYYSGHGWQDNSLPQPAYYLIPYDVSKNNLRKTALRADDFASGVADLAPDRLLVLLDCCHAGGMDVKDILPENLTSFAIPAEWFMGGEESVPIDSGSKSLDVALLSRGHGRAVLNSSRCDEKSYIRRDRKMSIFTYHLIESLTGYVPHRSEDKEVTVADVLGHIWRTIPTSANAEYGAAQHPDGQLSGNFPVSLLLGGKGVSPEKALPDPLADLKYAAMLSQTAHDGKNTQIVFSGTFAAPVTLNKRNINTGGGDYIEGNKILTNGTEKQDEE